MPNSGKIKLVFFGDERLATGVTTTAPTLQKLLAADYDVAAVVSHHSEGASRKQRELEIATIAQAHGIPVLLPQKPAELIDQLASYAADIGVLVAYGKIVPQSIIDIFRRGIINIHPSLLPLHRGPIPLESVILDGSHTSGISIMQLVKAMDAGGVYGTVTRSLTGDELTQDLADQMLNLGGDLLLQLLPEIVSGVLQPIPQDDTAATYDSLIAKSDGVMDFHKPAVQLEREIRAYAGWPGSRTMIGERDVVITAAHVLADATDGQPGSIWQNGKQFGFYTGDGLGKASGGVLVVDRLKPAGKAEMPTAAFLAGLRGQLPT